MIRILLVVVSILSLGVFSFNRTTNKVNPEVVVDVIEDINFDTSILHIQFCGDTLPLEQSLVAKRYQQAIQFYDHPSFTRSKSRIKKNAKIVEPILKRYGIPADFKFMPYVESAMNSNAVSPSGAAGYWQLMPATAQGLGLAVSDSLDERKDLIKSTHAAAKYLKWLYRELGDWALVAAAYNAGPNRIIRHMDLQNKDSYYALRLNAETTKYVYRLVAVKEWINRPARSNQWSKGETITQIARFVKLKKDMLNDQALAMLDTL
jgi:hypothetical protein